MKPAVAPPRRSWEQRLSQIPLWVLLTIPFMLQLLGAVGLVAYLANRSGRQSVNSLAIRWMEEAGARVSTYLTDYLRTPGLINQLNANAIRLGQIDPTNPDQLEQHFVQQIQTFDQVSRIRFSNPQGGLVSAGRDDRGLSVARTVPFRAGQLQVYQLDAQGHRGQRLLQQSDYDASQRPFHQVGQQAGQSTWGSVYVYIPATLGLGLPASRPVYDQAGHLQGVLSSDLMLVAIHQFLQQLPFSDQGQILILDRQGQLMATSTREPLSASSPTTDHNLLRQAGDSQDPLIRLTYQALISKFGSLDQIQTPLQINLQIQQQRQFITVSPFQDDWGLDWLIVTIVPEANFMADIRANNQHTLLLSGLTLVLAVATGLITSYWIAGPLRRLQLAAAAIAAGEFTHAIEPGGVREVAQLSQYFQQMAQQLDASFGWLKASEQRFRALIDQFPIGVNVFDGQGNPILINRVGRDLLGQDLVPDLDRSQVSKTYSAYKVGTDQLYPTDELPLMRALRGETSMIEDLELRLPDRTIPLQVHAIPVFDEAGQVIYVINAFQDISERRQAEQLKASYEKALEAEVAAQRQAIQVNEQRLQNLTETLPGTIFSVVCDTSGTMTFEYVNRTTDLLHNLPSQVLITPSNQIVLERMHPEDRPGFLQTLAQGMQQPGVYSYEWRVLPISDPTGPDSTGLDSADPNSVGSDLSQWIRVIARTEHRPHGEVCWHGVALDITEQKQSEAALRQSESINRAMLEALPDLILRQDRDGNYLDVKAHAALPILAKARPGMNVRDALPPESANLRLQAIDRAFATQTIQVYEFPLQIARQDVWIECRVVPLHQQQQVLVVLRDLTKQRQATAALRQSEAHNRAILSAIPDTIALVSADGIYLDSVRNNPGSDLLPAHIDPVGRPLSELLPPQVANRKLEAVQQAIATGQPQQYEQQIIRDNGLIQYEEVRVVACGEQTALVIIRDVSNRYEIDRIKDEFISIVSHELRTPLTAIRGALGILGTGVLDTNPQERTALLQIALNNSERLVYLINDILDLERLEAGQVPLILEPVVIADLMGQVLESVQTIAAEAEITLILDACEIRVMADLNAISQTLTNLLSNAIKFSSPGGQVVIWARVWPMSIAINNRHSPGSFIPDRALPASPPQLLCAVSDCGRGIPPDKLESIFERFQQVDASDARQRGGTGLGLTICKSIIQQHGGEIWAESRLGQGSTFYFTLPKILLPMMEEP